MEKATHNTGFVLVKAYTGSEWDNCDYAIIRLEEAWLQQMRERQQVAAMFEKDMSFSHLAYYDFPEGFYRDKDEISADNFLSEGEDWCFVRIVEGEPERLTRPENGLDTYQLIIHKNGTAFFTALGKYSNEEFYTEHFDIRDWT